MTILGFVGKSLTFLGYYVMAWICSFLIIVGTDFRLIPEYFLGGWTFTGLELVAAQWVLALLFFGGLLFVHWFFRRFRRRLAEVAAQGS